MNTTPLETNQELTEVDKTKTCSELESELTEKADPNHSKCSGRGYRSWTIFKPMEDYLKATGNTEEEVREKTRIPIPCSCIKR